jgi:hypothetical protein
MVPSFSFASNSWTGSPMIPAPTSAVGASRSRNEGLSWEAFFFRAARSISSCPRAFFFARSTSLYDAHARTAITATVRFSTLLAALPMVTR